MHVISERWNEQVDLAINPLTRVARLVVTHNQPHATGKITKLMLHDACIEYARKNNSDPFAYAIAQSRFRNVGASIDGIKNGEVD